MHAQPALCRAAILLAFVAAACDSNASARSAPDRGTVATGTAATAAVPASATSAAPNDSLVAKADAGRIQGDPRAKVWVIEISDFQCPYCRQWHEQNYGQIKREYVDAGKVRFAYLNYPIASLHPHALLAAEYAMCAAAQGKFWAMHDALFTSQQSWEGRTDVTPVFDSLSAKSGVDAGRLRACVDSHIMRPLIQADMDRSTQRGTNSTPTVIIGNEKLVGVEPIDAYRKAIDAALAAAQTGAPASKP